VGARARTQKERREVEATTTAEPTTTTTSLPASLLTTRETAGRAAKSRQVGRDPQPPSPLSSAVQQPADEGADLVLVERAVVEEEEGGVPALLRLLRLVPVPGHDPVPQLVLGRVGRLWVLGVGCSGLGDGRGG
jgi:hypothetical protein